MQTAIKLESLSAGTGSESKTKGRITGSVERNTRQKTPAAPSPIVAVQAWSDGWLWQRAQTRVEARKVAWRKDGDNALRQPLRNRLPRFFGVANAAHRSEGIVFAATRGEAVHEIHNGINDAPGEVAAQRPDEHFAHIRLARAAHAQRLVNVSTMIAPPSTSRTRSMGSRTSLIRTLGSMESYRKLGCQKAIAERIETKMLFAPISSRNPVRSSIV
jgi:hypothetical protein